LAANLDLRAALVVVAAAMTIGIVLGALAGFVRRLDEPLMRVTDVFLSIPSLVLAMAIASVLGRSIENLAIALVFVLPADARPGAEREGEALCPGADRARRRPGADDLPPYRAGTHYFRSLRGRRPMSVWC
jgi:uncharacterized membrane protein YfcA